jgi:hypothetical protein
LRHSLVVHEHKEKQLELCKEKVVILKELAMNMCGEARQGSVTGNKF